MDPVKTFKIDIKKAQARRPILLFIILTLFLPFFESKKIMMWDSPRGSNSLDIFYTFVLDYAKATENIKIKLGFRKEKEEKGGWLSGISLFKDKTEQSSEGLNGNADNTDNANKSEQVLDLSVEEIQKQKQDFKISLPYKFLILGDSFMAVMGGVGDILEAKLITYQNTEALRVGKVSSGLSRPDYFDWPQRAKELIASENSNIAVIMMGTNDAQSFEIVNSEGGKEVLKYGTNAWENEYRRRVRAFLQEFKNNNIFVYWIGMPIMKDPDYSSRIRGLDFIYEQEVINFSNAIYISTWELLSDGNGNYAASLPDSQGTQNATRIADGVHLTRFAGDMVVDYLINKMSEKIGFNMKVLE